MYVVPSLIYCPFATYGLLLTYPPCTAVQTHGTVSPQKIRGNLSTPFCLPRLLCRLRRTWTCCGFASVCGSRRKLLLLFVFLAMTAGHNERIRSGCEAKEDRRESSSFPPPWGPQSAGYSPATSRRLQQSPHVTKVCRQTKGVHRAHQGVRPSMRGSPLLRNGYRM